LAPISGFRPIDRVLTRPHADDTKPL